MTALTDIMEGVYMHHPRLEGPLEHALLHLCVIRQSDIHAPYPSVGVTLAAMRDPSQVQATFGADNSRQYRQFLACVSAPTVSADLTWQHDKHEHQEKACRQICRRATCPRALAYHAVKVAANYDGRNDQVKE